MIQKIITRKVKKRRAKDYMRDAKYYDWYYIVYKNSEIGLNLNGWRGWSLVSSDEKGKFIDIYPVETKEGKGHVKCYLEFD